ncbi:MAG: CCA tRNA nucleotidyltransferase [Pseudomonadota bacterium]
MTAPDGALASLPWMTSSATRAVVAALTAEGAEVRFVGGCVRDSLAGRPVKDVDIATVDPPDKVLALLAAAGLKGVPTGLAHGTVTAVAEYQPFEVTTLRRDVETHGRHATVAFTDDWQADAARRDFTMNAMTLSPEGALQDPFGGRADLADGRVRFVGRARDRIEEDYLRLLRFFRFHATYGKGTPDPEGLAAARDLAPKLTRLSGERIRAELLRLLGAEDPVPVLEVMDESRIWSAVLPDLTPPAVLKTLIAQGHGADEILRLAALLPDGEAGERVAERLRLSRRERERLVAALTGDVPLAPKALRRALYHHGRETVGDRLALAHARGACDAGQAETAWGEIERWQPISFPLKGRDALAIGLVPGAELGRLLGELEAWWIDEDFQPDREACLARLKERAGAP